MKNKSDLILSGPVSSALISLVLPMIFGMLSLFIINLVDAYYIGKLGVIELLLGKRDDKIYYSEFESVLNEEKKIDLEYKLDLSQWFFGLGLSF